MEKDQNKDKLERQIKEAQAKFNPNKNFLNSDYIDSNQLFINDVALRNSNFWDVNNEVLFSDGSSYLTNLGLPSVSSTLNKSIQALENEVNDLKKERFKLLEEKKTKEELQAVNEKLNKRIKLSHLVSNVNDLAKQKLLDSEDFVKLFEGLRYTESYVLSMDIRRSTDLMLKSRRPDLFVGFMQTLCIKLRNVILNNFGVYDKFTGDGILAFFPSFYSGKDAGLLAVKSAIECHQVFEEHYRKNRHCFTSVLTGVGLGVGIDFGNTCVVNMVNSLTVVGEPVVYACRFSAAKAGETLLNQTAYENIVLDYSKYFNFEETTIDVKNEGETFAYKVTSNDAKLEYQPPNWDESIKEYKQLVKNKELKNGKSNRN